MSAAGLALQRALFAAIEAQAELAGVYDHVPPGATYPYAVIGPDVVTDAGTKTGDGREHRLSVAVWDGGASCARIKRLMAGIEAAVTAMPAALGDGQRLVGMRFLRSFVDPAPGGPVRGVIEFRARTARD